MKLDKQTIREVLLYLKDELDRDFDDRLINASTHCDIDSWIDVKLIKFDTSNKYNNLRKEE